MVAMERTQLPASMDGGSKRRSTLRGVDPEMPHAQTAEVVVGIAEMIGIDVVKEPEYLWIAEEASRSDLPREWMQMTNEDGEVMYYKKADKEEKRKLQKVHPLIEKFAQIYNKQRSHTKLMMEGGEQKEDLPKVELGGVVREITSRVVAEKPPATPLIIEQLCQILDVDSTKEYFLVRAIKHTLETYVEKKFNLLSFARDLEDPLTTLRTVRKKQTTVDVIRKPGNITIIMCQECDKKSAIIKCEQCRDYFCQDCFNATHATGKRRAHITSDVEQLVCAAYDDRVATCQCVQCGLFYSDQGFKDVHSSRPELHNHLKRVINGLVCLECEHYNASVLCEDCVDIFCTECFIKLHRKGRRRQHVHLTIDNTGQIYRAGFLVPYEEAQILMDRARSTDETGPWLAFRSEEGLDLQYYHLKEKVLADSPIPAGPKDAAPAIQPE